MIIGSFITTYNSISIKWCYVLPFRHFLQLPIKHVTNYPNSNMIHNIYIYIHISIHYVQNSSTRCHWWTRRRCSGCIPMRRSATSARPCARCGCTSSSCSRRPVSAHLYIIWICILITSKCFEFRQWRALHTGSYYTHNVRNKRETEKGETTSGISENISW